MEITLRAHIYDKIPVVIFQLCQTPTYSELTIIIYGDKCVFLPHTDYPVDFRMMNVN